MTGEDAVEAEDALVVAQVAVGDQVVDVLALLQPVGCDATDEFLFAGGAVVGEDEVVAGGEGGFDGGQDVEGGGVVQPGGVAQVAGQGAGQGIGDLPGPEGGGLLLFEGEGGGQVVEQGGGEGEGEGDVLAQTLVDLSGQPEQGGLCG